MFTFLSPNRPHVSSHLLPAKLLTFQRSQRSSRSKFQLDSAMLPSNQTSPTQKVPQFKNSPVSVSSAMYANFDLGAEPRG